MPDTSKDLFRFLLHSPIDDIFRQIITGISILTAHLLLIVPALPERYRNRTKTIIYSAV